MGFYGVVCKNLYVVGFVGFNGICCIDCFGGQQGSGVCCVSVVQEVQLLLYVVE